MIKRAKLKNSIVDFILEKQPELYFKGYSDFVEINGELYMNSISVRSDLCYLKEWLEFEVIPEHVKKYSSDEINIMFDIDMTMDHSIGLYSPYIPTITAQQIYNNVVKPLLEKKDI